MRLVIPMATINKHIAKNGEASYRIRCYNGYDKDGKQNVYFLTWKPSPNMTEKQVEKELNRQAVAFEDRIRKGLVLDMNTTFSEYAELWMQHAEIAPKTRERYVSLLKRINPAIGHMRLSKLNKYHIMEFIQQMKSEYKLTMSKVTAKTGTKEKILNYFGSRGNAAKSAGLSPATLTEICKGDIVNHQSAEKLCKAMQTDVKKLFKIKETEETLSNNTIQKHYALINVILNQAVRDDLIPFNPSDSTHIKPPKIERPEAQYLKEDQLVSVITALKDEPIKWQTAILLALYTGCRRGELMGLEWSDIDFKNKKISIKRTSQYVSGMGIITKSPKTKKGYRVLEFDNSLSTILKKYRTWWCAEHLKMGDLWQEYITIIDVNGTAIKRKNERLFINADSLPMHPDSLTSWVKKFCDRHGLAHFSPHKVRHTTVSLLFANGVDIRTIADIVGHAQTSTTLNVYAHVMASAKKTAAQKLGDAIANLGENIPPKDDETTG